jgi:signal transduction histidine kinase
MKALSKDYLTGLRLHGEQGLEVHLEAAQQLGATAVRMGVGTLELAKIHQAALKTILPSSEKLLNKELTTQRAEIFFNAAMAPIEKTHSNALDAAAELHETHADLDQRTKDLADSKRQVEQKIEQRDLAEDALHTSEETCSQLLIKSRALQEELRLLSRRLLFVQEEERKRISRELHDIIAQTLTGINLQLALFKSKAVSEATNFHEKIEMTQQLIEKSVNTVHRFARDLRPAVLDDLGLIPALKSYLDDFMKDTGIRTSLTAFAGVTQLSNDKCTVLYRVAQEALSNVAQHAQASHTEVKIHQYQETVCMEINDNGSGFLVNEEALFGRQSTRLGLLGMRERVEMIGGKFRVESALGKETTVYVEIPQLDTESQEPAKTSPKST